MILVLSNQEDAHVSTVTKELDRRGAIYTVLDPALFPSDVECVVENCGERIEARLEAPSISISLSDVRSVWVRRPGKFVLPDRLSQGEAKWLRTECEHLFDGIWENLRAFWISEPRRINRASRKLLQLQTASAIGLKIPRFLITNSPQRAGEFIDACPKGTIVKGLASPALMTEDQCAYLYTHLVSQSDLRYLDSVRYGPNFFQEFLLKRLDIRVTVVGTKVFSIGIDATNEESGKVDFRRAEVFDLPHFPLELPQRMNDACVQLVQELGLQFGAIDLIQTETDEYYFLEINPNGQWLWLEWMTEIPISKAICDLLISAG